MIANFDSHKGAVDISNEDLYRYIRLSGHRHWESLTAMSVVHSMMVNAWSLYEEYVLHNAQSANRHLTPTDLERMKRPLHVYLAAAFTQLVAEYKDPN